MGAYSISIQTVYLIIKNNQVFHPLYFLDNFIISDTMKKQNNKQPYIPYAE